MFLKFSLIKFSKFIIDFRDYITPEQGMVESDKKFNKELKSFIKDLNKKLSAWRKANFKVYVDKNIQKYKC